MDEVIAALLQRVAVAPATDCQCVPPIIPRPPLPNKVLLDFERETGLELPVILRRLFTEVGNGGFGPAWGINPLTDEHADSIATWDQLERSNWPDSVPPKGWPDPLVRFCEIGCNAYYGVDIRSGEFPVYVVDPLTGSKNPVDWLTLENQSVSRWLHDWAIRKPPTLAAGRET